MRRFFRRYAQWLCCFIRESAFKTAENQKSRPRKIRGQDFGKSEVKTSVFPTLIILIKKKLKRVILNLSSLSVPPTERRRRIGMDGMDQMRKKIPKALNALIRRSSVQSMVSRNYSTKSDIICWASWFASCNFRLSLLVLDEMR